MREAARRRQRLLALFSLVAACGRADAPTPVCKQSDLARGVERLEQAPPPLRPLVAAQALQEACGDGLPSSVRAYLSFVEADIRGVAPPPVESSEQERGALFERACPIDATARAAALGNPVGRARAVYDACGFAERGIVEPGEVDLHFGGTPIVWSTHTWLVENRVPGKYADPLSRALFFHEAWHANPIGVRPTISLAHSDASPAVTEDGVPVYLTLDELGFGFDARPLVALREGGLPRAELADGRITKLSGPMSEARAAGAVVIVADRGVAAGTILAVSSTALAAGHERVLLAVRRASETAPYGAHEVTWVAGAALDREPELRLELRAGVAPAPLPIPPSEGARVRVEVDPNAKVLELVRVLAAIGATERPIELADLGATAAEPG